MHTSEECPASVTLLLEPERAHVHETLLLATNDVWAKVMVLHMSVILSMGGLCMMSLPVWLPGPSGGVPVPGSMFLLEVSVQRGVSVQGQSL